MLFWQQFKISTLAELPQALLRSIIPDLTWVLAPATSLQAKSRALEKEMASEGSGRGNALCIPLSSSRIGAMNTKTSWWCYIHIINNYNFVWIQCLSTHCEVSVHTRAEDGKGEFMMLQSEILGWFLVPWQLITLRRSRQHLVILSKDMTFFLLKSQNEIGCQVSSQKIGFLGQY